MKATVLALCVLILAAFAAPVDFSLAPVGPLDTEYVELDAARDTWIWPGSGPYGSSTELRINRDSEHAQRVVIAWDLTMFDDLDDVVIESALMRVFRYAGNNDVLASVYRVTEDWDEYTLVYPLAFDDTTVWAEGDAGDPNGWKEFDITDLVQAWVDGDYDNFGVICLGTSGSGFFQRWYSRENDFNQPYLAVEYYEDDDPSNVVEASWGQIKATE